MFQHAKWDDLQWPGGEATPDREDGGMVEAGVSTIVVDPAEGGSLFEEWGEAVGAIELRSDARRRDPDEEEEEDEYEENDEDFDDDEGLDDDLDDDAEEEEEEI
jgi:hypothetical protein